MRVCFCVCVCVYVCLFVRVHIHGTISNIMLKDASEISFIIVLTNHNFFSNDILFQTFMTISSMNANNGTNMIVPTRTTHGITSALQKLK